MRKPSIERLRAMIVRTKELIDKAGAAPDWSPEAVEFRRLARDMAELIDRMLPILRPPVSARDTTIDDLAWGLMDAAKEFDSTFLELAAARLKDATEPRASRRPVS